MLAACDGFQIAGRLVSVQGLITTTLPAAIGQRCQIISSHGIVPAEVIGFSKGLSLIMPLQNVIGLAPDDLVVGFRKQMTVPVGVNMLGRIVDAVGKPIDNKGPLVSTAWVPIQRKSPNPLDRAHIHQPFVTGQKAIDALLTLGRGQRVGLFAGSGVGKSTLLGEIAKQAEADINIVALVGERGREVRPFIENCLGPKGLSRSIVIVSTADQPALLRIRAAQTAITLADWFRDRGHHVLFMIDSLTRLASAQRELGLLLGEPPSARGFPPSCFQLLANLIEQLGNTSDGSVTGLLTVLVEGDDVSEPVADAARAILDGHIVLSRDLAEREHFPAIDIAGSISRVFSDVTDSNQQQHAKAIREMLKTYQEVEDLIRIGAYKSGTSPNIDRAIQMKSAVEAFLTQDVGHASDFDTTTSTLARLAQAWSAGELVETSPTVVT